MAARLPRRAPPNKGMQPTAMSGPLMQDLAPAVLTRGRLIPDVRWLVAFHFYRRMPTLSNEENNWLRTESAGREQRITDT